MNRDNLFPTYAPANIRFASGEGSWLTDTRGRRYLDFIAGISVNTLGHAHPALVAALHAQAQKLWHLSNMFDVPGQSELAHRYCELTFADRVFFTNSGAESIECALKSARRHHAANGAPHRIDVIGFEGAFHGRTYATINVAGNPKYLEGFGPSLPGYIQAPFGNLAALEALIGPNTAAILIEPVQGEGGLRAAPVSNLEAIRKICDEHDILLIYDEVQCGAGRTGQLFAHQWSDKAAPDIMAVAKGVGGGFPMGMCLATEAVARHMTPGTHGTTYGGNALAVAVGGVILDYLTAPGFLETVRTRANLLREALEGLRSQYPGLVDGIRGKGLLTGFKLNGVTNTDLRDTLRENGLLVGVAGDNVIRLAPPLNVKPEEITEAISKLASGLGAAASKTGHLASAAP